VEIYAANRVLIGVFPGVVFFLDLASFFDRKFIENERTSLFTIQKQGKAREERARRLDLASLFGQGVS
jgi:hypothetical protein